MSMNDLYAVMDAAVDAIVLMDQDGLVSAFNRSAERMFGYAADEIIGGNVNALMPEPYRSKHDAYVRRFVETREPHIIGIGREVEAQRKDGSVFPAFVSVGMVAGSDPPRFVGLIRDATIERDAMNALRLARSRAEEAQSAEQQARRLQDRLTRVASLAMLGEMASGIAHEINQPLSAIATYANACSRMLAAPQADIADTQEALQAIANEALRAGEMIRRLRRLVDKPAPQRSDVDFNELMIDVAKLAQSEARVHAVRIELELDENLPAVLADAHQIQHMILALLRNAIEALAEWPSDSRRIVLRTGRPSPTHVEISVADNGPGVAPSLSDRLFTPFATTRPHGTGLGLAASQTIARAHGGVIGYRPLSPTGSCFCASIPIAGGSA